MSFEDIIDRVKTRPEIWQRAHPLYKNKVLRLRIWNQLSKELDTDANQLKKSWKYLNDQYRREYKKMKSLAPYEGKPIPCGWAYYDRLSFLDPEMAGRKDRRPARIPASSDSDTAPNDSAMTQESLGTTEAFTMESLQQDDSNDNYESISWKYNAAKQQGRQSKPGFSTTRPSGSSGVTKADLILRRLQNLSAKISRPESDRIRNDEDYMFFMSILPMVRTLTPIKKLQLRMKINEWLLQTLSGDSDPLTSVGQYMVPVEETCEDNKEAILQQIMQTEDEES